MKNIITLTKSLFLNSFRGGNGKKKIGISTNLIGMAVAGGIFGIMFVVMTVFLGPILHENNLDAEFVTMLYIVAQIIVLLFGTVMLISIMFFSKDAEFLLSLPLKTNHIFIAKIFYVYITELAFAAFIVGVSGITYGIMASLGFSYYVMLLLSILFVPILPLLLSALVSIPVMYVVSFLKGKAVFTTVAFVVIFGVLMYFYMNMFNFIDDGSGDTVIDISGQLAAIKQSMSVMYPNISMARIVTLQSANYLFDGGVVAVFSAGLLLLTLAVTTFTFKRGMSTQLESGGNSASGDKIEFEESSTYKTILTKELREIIRSPGLAFYCIYQTVIAPLIIYFYSKMLTGDSMDSPEISGLLSTAMSFFIMILLVGGVNYTALSSVSREGQNFYMAKTLPVPFKFQLTIKIRLSDIVTLISIIACAVVFVIMGNPNFLQILMFSGFMMIYCNAINYRLTYADVKNPILDWDSITVALKNHKAIYMSMLISFLTALPLVGGYAAISVMLDAQPATQAIVFAAFWVVMYGFAILLNYFSRKRFNENVDTLIASFE